MAAAVIGVGAGLLCGHLPEEWRGPCSFLAKAVAAVIGGS